MKLGFLRLDSPTTPLVILVIAASAMQGFFYFSNGNGVDDSSLSWMTGLVGVLLSPPIYFLTFYYALYFGVWLLRKKQTPTMLSPRFILYLLIYCIANVSTFAMVAVAMVTTPVWEVPRVAVLSLFDMYPLFLLAAIPYIVIAAAVRFRSPE